MHLLPTSPKKPNTAISFACSSLLSLSYRVLYDRNTFSKEGVERELKRVVVGADILLLLVL